MLLRTCSILLPVNMLVLGTYVILFHPLWWVSLLTVLFNLVVLVKLEDISNG